MTAEIDRILDLRFGKHSSAASFTATPGTLRRLNPETCDFRPKDHRRLERVLKSADNKRFSGVIGPSDLSAHQLSMMLRGTSSPGGAAFTPQSTMDCADVLDVVVGSASPGPVGVACTAVAAGSDGATKTLVLSGTSYANGDMLLFSTDVGVFLREVVSGGGTTTVVLDRIFTGTVVNGGAVARAARWNHDPTVHDHVHGGFSVEAENWKQLVLGCMAESMEITFAEGEVAMLTTSWLPTVLTPDVDGSLSFTAPTAGQEIVCVNGAFWIGDVQYLTENMVLRWNNRLRPRRTPQGANGVLGYVVVEQDDVSLSGRIYAGSNSGSLGEMQYDAGTPSFRDLTEGNTTRDIAFQIGTVAGAALYVRIPAADIRATAVESDGLTMWEVQAMATRPSSGSNCRIGIF